MEIRKDFKELLESLNSRKAEYIVVGAFALAWHGHPRYTGDLDLYINPSIDNASRIIAALDDFGFGSLGLSETDFRIPEQVIQLGAAPIRVDMFTSITGVDWESAWGGSEQGAYGDVAVRYLGKKEYIANKKAMGRHRDLADVESIES
jgi:hypothetical protein